MFHILIRIERRRRGLRATIILSLGRSVVVDEETHLVMDFSNGHTSSYPARAFKPFFDRIAAIVCSSKQLPLSLVQCAHEISTSITGLDISRILGFVCNLQRPLLEGLRRVS